MTHSSAEMEGQVVRLFGPVDASLKADTLRPTDDPSEDNAFLDVSQETDLVLSELRVEGRAIRLVVRTLLIIKNYALQLLNSFAAMFGIERSLPSQVQHLEAQKIEQLHGTTRAVSEEVKNVTEDDEASSSPVYERAAKKTSESTILERVRSVVLEVAHHRPERVLHELNQLSASGEHLSLTAQEMLVKAIRTVGTARAAAHVVLALDLGLPLTNPNGKLVLKRGTIVLTRDITRLETTARPIPPATDLSERGIFIDSHLRIGQEGTIPDLGGQAARWQHRPEVRMSELRDELAGHPTDEIIETSTGAKFDYVPPRRQSSTGVIPHPIVIRQCDDKHSTPQTSDDC